MSDPAWHDYEPDVIDDEDDSGRVHEGDPDVVDRLDVLSKDGRHASLTVMCGLLHGVIVARAVAEMLANGKSALPARGSIWVAPSFAWLVPRVDVGRKGRGPRGTRLRLPVRLQWAHVVEVVPVTALRTPVAYGWTTTSMGHSGVGQTLVSLTHGHDVWETAESEAGIPVQAYGPVMDRDEMWEALHRIHREGSQAEWEFLNGIERNVHTALHRAHASLAHEISEFTGVRAPLLDSIKIEKVRDRMLLGTTEDRSKVQQMLARLIDPVSQDKVDPLRYIEVALRRDAKEELRKEIGDPRIGARVRRVQRDLQCPDVDTLVTEFRKMFPKAYLSHDRANAALNVTPDPMAEWWPINDNDDGDDEIDGYLDDDLRGESDFFDNMFADTGSESETA